MSFIKKLFKRRGETREIVGLLVTSDPDETVLEYPLRLSLKPKGSIVLYARARDKSRRWYPLPDDVIVEWETDQPTIFEVTPVRGHSVNVKCVRKGSGKITARSKGLEPGYIRVKIG